MRNTHYIVNVPPWGKVYYIVNLTGGSSTMGEGLLYDTGIVYLAYVFPEKILKTTIYRL